MKGLQAFGAKAPLLMGCFPVSRTVGLDLDDLGYDVADRPEADIAMNLDEYFAAFQKAVGLEHGNLVTSQVAAELAAGHAIGLSIEQMHSFLTRRTQITSAAIALKGGLLTPNQIARIDAARAGGAVYPNEVIAKAFSREEVRPELHSQIFGD